MFRVVTGLFNSTPKTLLKVVALVDDDSEEILTAIKSVIISGKSDVVADAEE